MFVHSGTGLHAHEFSNPRIKHLPARSPLSRSAFSAPLPTLPVKSTTYEHQRRSLRPWSEKITPIKEPVVRFQELEQDTMSEDGRSISNSESSNTTAGGGSRRRRSLRTSSTFYLAHPAPTLTQKQKLLQIRPRLLLQLQQVSPGARPKPSLDVVPSTVVVPRLYKKFPRMFRGKGELGANDVMIVKSEDYESAEVNQEGSDSDEDGMASRDLVAVICQMPKESGGSQGKAEIVLRDGSVWVASPLLNGTYEFQSTSSIDGKGNKKTARWVRKTNRRRSADAQEAIVKNANYSFSIVDPNTRRHPILATINQTKLEIPDSYTSISPSAGIYPPSSNRTSADEATTLHDEAVPERTTIVLEEHLKTLIQVTGIWIALRQGWSPSFKYNDAMTSMNTSSCRIRAVSLTRDSGRPSPAQSPAPTFTSTPDSSSSALKKMRRKSSICPGSPPLDRTPSTPKRSVSAGTAFMQRAAARRAGLLPSTVPSDSEGESMMEAQQELAKNDTAHDSSELSTPQASFTLPGSATTTPDTPARTLRRPHSYVPTTSSNLLNGVVVTQPSRSSMVVMRGNSVSSRTSTPEKQPKLGRWKSFVNKFRRSRCGRHSSSSS
ncbi:hypothetical protein QTJ16_003276 [Diplocarpon rosae]|uniref:Uncharacterized protein n=1 Tax=Diplocarpon rosae TaxID=946125 RepID=A0AAD9T0W6_9HELO|nr:hypothetical protein QTJ16_003276 [Diplocarpon rosae]PBP25319.1 hypothetical protein BUE80_DR003762 [Diplocarpon rosae]